MIIHGLIILVVVVERRIACLADDNVPKVLAFGANGIERDFHARLTAWAENVKHDEPFRSECRDMSGRGNARRVLVF